MEYYKQRKIYNFSELLAISIENNSDEVAFFFNNKEKNTVYKTYNDFYNDVINMKNYIAKSYKNKHIGIIAENSYEWLVIFLGITLSGNVAVIIDKDLKENIIMKLLKKSDTKIIFNSKYCRFLEEYKYLTVYSIEDFNKYLEIGKKEKFCIKVDQDKCSVIFFTSGTTGANKAVMLSQHNICNNIYGATSVFLLNGSSFAVLPFHHSLGLVIGALAPFYYHYPVFINSSLKNIMSEIQIAKPQTMVVVPMFIETFYKQIWATARKENRKRILKRGIKWSNRFLKIGIDLRGKLFKQVIDAFGGNLKYIICGGSYLDKKYVKWFRSIGIEILNGYGITECSPVISVNSNNYHKDGSVGIPIKEAQVKIVDNEILFKSESVMLGYYKDFFATNEVLKKGWFYTGDYGYFDDEGFLYITGRKKNLIILNNGENISPEVIEEELLKDDGVCECVVYAKDNMIIASIYPNEDYIADQEYFDNLIYEYNKGLPKNRQIAMVTLRTTEFIKNNNKKILRNKVEEKENEK